MSITTCQYCSAQVDSDIDLECFAPDGQAVCEKCRGELDAGIGYAMRALYRPEWDEMEHRRKLKIAMGQLQHIYGDPALLRSRERYAQFCGGIDPMLAALALLDQ